MWCERYRPECSKERKFQGAKVPESELARVLLELSLQAANWPGSEKARYRSTVRPVLGDPLGGTNGLWSK